VTVITIAIAIVFANDIAIGIAIAIYDATEIQKCNRMQQKCNRNETAAHDALQPGGGDPPRTRTARRGSQRSPAAPPSRTRARKRGSTGGSLGALPGRGSRGEARPEDSALIPHRGRGTGFYEAVAGGASSQSEGRQTGATGLGSARESLVARSSRQALRAVLRSRPAASPARVRGRARRPEGSAAAGGGGRREGALRTRGRGRRAAAR